MILYDEDDSHSGESSTISEGNGLNFDELFSAQNDSNPFSSSTDISSDFSNPDDWKLPEIKVFADPRIKGIRSTKAKKRKLSGLIEYKFHHIPRILKNDIRRQYGIMFTNVYNSGDFEYMRRFCATFCCMNTSLTVIRREFSERKKEHSGFKECGGLWYDSMNEAPDLVCTLTSNQFKLRSDGTSVNSGTFTLRGTKYFQMNHEELQYLKQIISNKPQYQLLLDDTHSSTEIDYPHQVRENHFLSSFDTSESLSLSTNEDNRSMIMSSNSTSNNFHAFPIGNHICEITESIESFPVPPPHEISELALLIEQQRIKHNSHSTQSLLSVPVAFELNGEVSLHLDADSAIYYFDIVIG